MRHVDAILEDYRERQDHINLIDRICQIDITKKVSTLFEAISSKFSYIFKRYLSNPKFHRDVIMGDLFKWKGYSKFDICGPTTLESLYEYFGLSGKEIEEIEQYYVMKAEGSHYYGACYQFDDSFDWDVKHKNLWGTFVDNIPQFHLMGNLCDFSLAKDGLQLHGRFLAIYVNPRNKNIARAITKIKASNLIDV